MKSKQELAEEYAKQAFANRAYDKLAVQDYLAGFDKAIELAAEIVADHTNMTNHVAMEHVKIKIKSLGEQKGGEK